VTANGQADWIKGGETITEFTFTAASGGGCRAESMDAKLDAGEDPTEDNEAGERAARGADSHERICGFGGRSLLLADSLLSPFSGLFAGGQPLQTKAGHKEGKS
jgi:hypothetical protein